MKEIAAAAIAAAVAATAAIADKPGPESKTNSTSKGPACRWQAHHDFMPPTPARLAVTGKCMMPTPGYKLTLSKLTPQGINPAVLLLKLESQPPSGIVNQVVTETKVEAYEVNTNTPYKTVTIQPMGDDVPVKETH